MALTDPTDNSLAVYGTLLKPGEIYAYYFIPKRSVAIPLELLVPKRGSSSDMFPTLVLAHESTATAKSMKPPTMITQATDLDSPDPAGATENKTTPGGSFLRSLPDTLELSVFETRRGAREAFFEPFSLEYLYHGNEQDILLEEGVRYYLLVFEPRNYTGDYVIGLGDVEDFSDVSFVGLLKEVLFIKLGLYGGRSIPWGELIGLFIFMAGFIVGLGAVTVIDLHGFLGRTSPYWAETTIRAHKVTKPLIWIGFVLCFIGGYILYRDIGLSATAALQLIVAIPLVLNGAFLSFYISPRLLAREREGSAQELLPSSMQAKIALSFVLSFLGWWTEVFLLAYYLMVIR
ncbi:MAG: hypothetical protein KGZ93_10420 [Actinobacteria bacterium]|nr:hypothetical protein [Actinomycetota bacterium]